MSSHIHYKKTSIRPKVIEKIVNSTTLYNPLIVINGANFYKLLVNIIVPVFASY